MTIADVRAALMYYHDSRKLLERQDRQARELVEQLASKYPSKLDPRFKKDASDDPVSSPEQMRNHREFL